MKINGIDKIFCINLDRRPDRWNAFCNNAKGAGFDDIERVSGIDGNNLSLFKALPVKFDGFHGSIGCSWSHWMISKLVLKNNWDNVLVFEDDVKFIYDFTKIRDFIHWALTYNPLQIHLGEGGSLGSNPERLDHGYRVSRQLNLHGYVISRDLASVFDIAMNRCAFRSDLTIHADRLLPELICAIGGKVIVPLDELCKQDKSLGSNVRWGCPDRP